MAPGRAPRPAATMPDAPTAPRPALVSWSGGKDSALALHAALADPSLRVTSLLTTVTDEYDRVSMHGVRRALLEAQARAVQLPLDVVRIPPACSNQAYEAAMTTALARHRDAGVREVVFGDLFLRDVREYRERLLAPLGMTAVFPLWGRDTAALAREFVALGFRATLVCVDPRQLDPAFCGRPYDEALLRDLPPGADACGENGEFHTFVYDGPVFARAVAVSAGEVVERDGFRFADLLAGASP